jgi:hypothetical protein
MAEIQRMTQIKNIEIKTHTDNQFGVFQIELEKTEITEDEQEINLMIDKSGSMDDMCGDGTTKMHQIKYVTKNILRFVAKNCTKGNVKISLKAFNVDVETIFDKTVVAEDSLDELIAKIDKVYANDGTDIGVALTSMHSSGPNRHNIFMSDGDANVGITESAELAEMVDKNAINTFVGFGLEHNPQIFAALSETKNSSYYFVDKVEKSGNAYGEILDGILYNCLKDVTIKIVGGTLYNWKTNEWTTEIFVGNMSSEAKKTFHIMSPKMEDVHITVCANNLAEEIVANGTNSKSEDLQKMIYRQKTLELLFKAKHTNQKMNSEEIRALKKELKDFVVEMKEYMKESNDALIKNLCDDIVITYRTLGTQYGQMYSCSRQTTQGEERLYNVSDTPTSNAFTPRRNTRALHRQNVFDFEEPLCSSSPFIIALDDIMDSHDVSEDTPYYSGRVATVMRSVTGQDAGEESGEEEC